MKTAFNIPIISIHFNYSALFTLTAIVCLAAIQATGIDASLPIATSAALLVFCSRQRVPTTWDLLMQVYLMRTSRTIKWDT